MVNRKTWEEFRECQLLWWINSMLHVFGWAIVYNFDSDGKIVEVYPARVKFRGFGEEQNTKGYIGLSKLMNRDSEELLKESEE